MASHTDSERLDALETRIAYQDQTIEELSQALAAQWKLIERLEREMARLTQMQQDMASALHEAPEPPPPHY